MYLICTYLREEAERKGREMAMLVAELQRMRAETNRQAVSLLDRTVGWDR